MLLMMMMTMMMMMMQKQITMKMQMVIQGGADDAHGNDDAFDVADDSDGDTPTVSKARKLRSLDTSHNKYRKRPQTFSSQTKTRLTFISILRFFMLLFLFISRYILFYFFVCVFLLCSCYLFIQGATPSCRRPPAERRHDATRLREPRGYRFGDLCLVAW